MAAQGYKQLISYQLAAIAFRLGWEFVPLYYKRYEDARQRDQIKQALRSYKQNIVEGSSERSLSSKLKLYDVAKASSMEALEDFQDILVFEKLPQWKKDDARLLRFHAAFERFPSDPSSASYPSIGRIRAEIGLGGSEGLDGKDRKDAIDAVVNYLIDVIIRGGYVLDKQINAVEKLHEREGGYNENLLKRRLAYRKRPF